MADVTRKTANLAGTEQGGISTVDGSDQAYVANLAQIRSQYIPCSAETTYYVACTEYPTQNFVAFYDANMTYLSRTSGMPITLARQFTTPANTAYMRVTMFHTSDGQIYPYIDGAKIMLNSGSKGLPYEPYMPHSLRKFATATGWQDAEVKEWDGSQWS